MADVYFKYNPYKLETVIRYNGKDISPDSKLYPYRGERLQVWMDRLVPIVAEECNDDNIHLTFHGTLLDYEDLQGAVAEESRDGNISFTLEHVEAQETDDKFKELVELFDDMQQGPFDDLKDENIVRNFRKALGSEFEVSVIATMSSGKSTLINAMLGQELVPSKHEACTALIARIKDVDGMQGFTAVGLDDDRNVVYDEQPVDLERMKQLNEDERISYIEAKGDIPFIQTRKANLILVDTPGPNNSRNLEHGQHTYGVIKNDAKPLVLYVLNATQLATDDDNNLLRKVAEAMSVGGKQSKDRFIFAVNKIDEYDTERADSITGALDNIRKYLAQYGIENPNLFPISAEMAKVIRLHRRGAALTRKQEKTLAEYDLYTDVSQMHLTQYAVLPAARKKAIEQLALAARERGDIYGETLIHTGLPAIEEAINEYLDKYAVTAKVKNAVDTFRKKVEEKRMLGNLLREIEDNTEEKDRINARLELVEKQLGEGKATASFKAKIQNLSFEDEKQEIKKLRSKIDTMLKGKVDQKMTVTAIDQEMARLIRKVDHLRNDVVTEMEKLVTDKLRADAERLVGEYVGHIQSLLHENAVSVDRFDVGSATFILGDVPDAVELIDRHKRQEQEKVGEKWVENTNKKIYKPWTWFQSKGHWTGIYEDREYVDGTKVFDEYLKPVRGNFYENIMLAERQMDEQSKALKQFFLNELDKLEGVIKAKVTELRALTGNSKALEERIRDDRTKMQWLQDFLLRLDSILEI